ncbi:hypothetical protein ACFWIA_20590 [Streptomyces sp. NPDC127068]|uniref:hypothetical protein n=1 Tax=Streptomyces sp. NPDC127068 TaxID=3347127 RepID=UPI0036535892
MRIKRTLALGAALVSLAAVGACGSDEGASDNDLPSASDMASVEEYLTTFVTCENLTTGDEYDDSGRSTAWGEEEAADASWAIGERAVCLDGNDAPIALLTIKDMKKFQTAADRDGNASFLVGQDFAVVPVSPGTVEGLKASRLKYLTCDPDFTAPSGSEKEQGLVSGCFLTDHFPTG